MKNAVITGVTGMLGLALIRGIYCLRRNARKFGAAGKYSDSGKCESNRMRPV